MRIGIVANHSKENALKAAQELLLGALNAGVEVVLEDKLERYPLFAKQRCLPLKALCAEVDDVFVLGGDGTILRAAHQAALCDVPVIGINWGVLGFLAELDRFQCEKALGRLLQKDYRIEERAMLKVRSQNGEEEPGAYHHGLNDVSLVRDPGNRIFRAQVFIDDQLAGEISGDGVLVSTPTGSTAYALSCGGPAIDPRLSCMVVTPVSARWHSFPPIVVHADAKIRVCPQANRDTLQICTDGHVRQRAKKCRCIEIQRSEHVAKFVRFAPYLFFEQLHKKIMPPGRISVESEAPK